VCVCVCVCVCVDAGVGERVCARGRRQCALVVNGRLVTRNWGLWGSWIGRFERLAYPTGGCRGEAAAALAGIAFFGNGCVNMHRTRM
jgi:hypothetical protein